MKKKAVVNILVTGLSLGLLWAQAAVSPPEPVKRIFRRSCILAGCHQGQYPAMSLNLEPDKVIASAVDADSREKPPLKIIDSRAPENSYLLKKIRGDQDIAGGRMPLKGDYLTEEEIQAMASWMETLKESGALRSVPEGSPPGKRGQRPEAPTFWGTRLVNLPTTRTIDRGHFLFRISHRFMEAFRSGYGSFYGLDGASVVLIGFGYGISDRLAVSLSRTNNFQEMELGVSWLLLDQDGPRPLPLSLAVQAGPSLVTQSSPGRGLFDAENIKLNFQLCLSSRLTDRLSLLAVPCFSTNSNHWEPASQSTVALGLGGRFMFLKDLSLLLEWLPVLSGYKDSSSGWGFGIEKKIGGHVFQFFVLNSLGLTSDQFVPGGDLRLQKGDFRLGFNIFRTF